MRILSTLLVFGFLASTSWAEIVFKDGSFAKISVPLDSQPIQLKLPFRNSSDKAFEVQKVLSNCGCSDAKLDSEFYAPGQEGVLSLTYTVDKEVGKRISRVIIHGVSEGAISQNMYTLEVVHEGWTKEIGAEEALRKKQEREREQAANRPPLTYRSAQVAPYFLAEPVWDLDVWYPFYARYDREVVSLEFDDPELFTWMTYESKDGGYHLFFIPKRYAEDVEGTVRVVFSVGDPVVLNYRLSGSLGDSFTPRGSHFVPSAPDGRRITSPTSGSLQRQSMEN